MSGSPRAIDRGALWLTAGAAGASMVSIAGRSILLVAAAVALIAARKRFELTPCWPAAAVFLLWTLVSLAFSPDPAAGIPQVLRLWVWLVLIVIPTAIAALAPVRNLFLGIAGAGALSAAWGLVQFWRKFEAARRAGEPFYQYYVGDRITGFMSHWMTFSGEMMIALLILLAWILFAPVRRKSLVVALAAFALVGAAIVLSLTRSVWLAAAAGVVLLLWWKRRWLIALAPAALLAAVIVSPGVVTQRISSFWNPGPGDTNEHRIALLRTGVKMTLAHPVVGVGPEQVERNVLAFMPPRYKPVPVEWWYGHLHNIYVQFAAERGLPALAALLAFVGWALRDFLRVLRRLPPGRGDRRFVLTAAVSCVAAILVAGIWEHNLGDGEILTLFLVIIAAGYVAIPSTQAPA